MGTNIYRTGNGGGGFVLIGFAFLLVLLSGCTAHFPINPETGSVDQQLQYQVKKVGQAKSDRVFIVLFFSGGGTRAASMSYGVLEALQAVSLSARPSGPEIRKPAEQGTLLDEVNLIVSVSGGAASRRHITDSTERTYLKTSGTIFLSVTSRGPCFGAL